MKILFIHDYPFQEGGGIEVQTYLDAIELAKKGHTVTIASTRSTSETYNGNVPGEALVICCYIDSEDQLKRLIISHEIVSVQATFSLRTGMMSALRILNEIGKRHIVCLRTTFKHICFSRLGEIPEQEKAELLQEFSLYLKSDLCSIQAVSSCFRSTLDFLGLSKPYEVIYNAKVWDDFLAEKGAPIEQVDITYIGEISWMKGLHVLLGAIPSVQNRLPGVTLRIIGNGQNKKEIQSLVSCCQFSNTRFVDYVENGLLSSYLKSTKILVVPSLTEAWCNVAMEALGCGTTVVGADIEGLSELLEQGKLGILFRPGDSIDLSEKIVAALSMEIFPKNIGYIQQKYSMTERIAKLEEFYRRKIFGKQ